MRTVVSGVRAAFCVVRGVGFTKRAVCCEVVGLGTRSSRALVAVDQDTGHIRGHTSSVSDLDL